MSSSYLSFTIKEAPVKLGPIKFAEENLVVEKMSVRKSPCLLFLDSVKSLSCTVLYGGESSE